MSVDDAKQRKMTYKLGAFVNSKMTELHRELVQVNNRIGDVKLEAEKKLAGINPMVKNNSESCQLNSSSLQQLEEFTLKLRRDLDSLQQEYQ